MLGDSMLVVCLGAIGALIGFCVSYVARMLPAALQRAWYADACEVLGLPQGYPAPKVREGGSNSLLRLGFSMSISSALTCWVVLHFGFAPKTLAALFLALGLLTLSMIDVEHMFLPDALVLPLLWVGILLNSFGLFASLFDAIWGAACAYLSLYLLNALYKLSTNRDGLGLGDAKLFAAIGAWGGWQVLTSTLLVAALSCVFVILGLLLAGKKINRGTLLPFGPFLALGGWFAIISTTV
ncbi:TPA: prepilin peptidase [Pseudomonas aeruginosa]|nr:prepilin peptidase [Pseudomonas aeruginosa]